MSQKESFAERMMRKFEKILRDFVIDFMSNFY